MIELLGVGVRDAGDAWLFRRVCARFERGALGAVVGERPAQSAALLDAVTGRSVPHEGRVWVTRLPLMRETRGRVRRLVGDATTASGVVTHRSVLWNTMARSGTTLAGLVPFPRHRAQQALGALAAVGLERRAADPALALSSGDRVRVAIARVLTRGPAVLVLRDIDAAIDTDDVMSMLATLRRVVRSQRLAAIVSLASLELAHHYADQVLVLPAGEVMRESEHARRMESAAR